jgi:hypothetical protein
MPRPSTLRPLIVPYGPSLTSAIEPCFDGWHLQIGPYAWYRVKCFTHAMGLAGVHYRDLLDARRDAVRSAPERWIEFCPTPKSINDEFGWGSLGEDRLNEVVFQRSRKKPSKNGDRSVGVTFPKAALSILALEIAARKTAPEFDIYEHVRICPAIYFVDGLDNAWPLLTADERGRLRDATFQVGVDAATLTAEKKRPMTYDMAERLRVALASKSGIGSVARLPDIGKPSPSSKPNHLEKVHCLIANPR